MINLFFLLGSYWKGIFINKSAISFVLSLFYLFYKYLKIIFFIYFLFFLKYSITRT
jgi:hypothetical protein